MSKLYLSEGNRKLRKSEGKRFLIWSLPAEETCPNATEACKKYCYAKKSERMYPSVRASRITNYALSMRQDFVSNMIKKIEEFISKKSWKKDTVYFRIHESGDFYSTDYFRKWIEIAKKFPNIHFAAYTKSFQFYDEVKKEIPSNFVVRASIWWDTKPQDLGIIERNNMPFFTALRREELEEQVKTNNLYKCIGDCQKCKVCYTNHKKVACELH